MDLGRRMVVKEGVIVRDVRRKKSRGQWDGFSRTGGRIWVVGWLLGWERDGMVGRDNSINGIYKIKKMSKGSN